MIKPGTLILCFHRISDEFSPAYPPIPIKEFEKVCSYAARRLLPVSPFDSISSKRRHVIFTFDDAYYDFYENALPILTKYRIPSVQHIITSSAKSGESFWTQKLNKIIEALYYEKATVDFNNYSYRLTSSKQVEEVSLKIYSNLLNDNNRDQKIADLIEQVKGSISYTKMMTWDNIKEATSHNVIIGSHTVNHANLIQVAENELEEELKNSRDSIVSRLGNEHGRILAYPNGQWNNRVANAAEKIGYDLCLTTEPRMVNKTDSSFALPRLMLYHKKWLKNFIKIKLAIIK